VRICQATEPPAGAFLERDKMERNRTFRLSPRQERAIEALCAGRTITAAGEAAGVSRGSLHRWLKTDPAFQAALAARTREMRDVADRRLLALVGVAVDAVEQALRTGDARTAVQLLRGLGVLSGQPPRPGIEDPEEIVRQRRKDEEFRTTMDRLLQDLRLG